MTTISDKLTSIYNAKKDIKSAINSKGQSVGDNINDYAAAIRNIEQGSGGGTELRNWWKVYFIDYDGTILSYQEVANGADFVFPDAPNHEDKGIVFDGWNFTSNHTTDYDPQDIYTIVIGAMYDVIGNTKFYYKIDKYYTKSVSIYLETLGVGNVTIYWGDGTNTVANNYDIVQYTHTYSDTYIGKDVVVELIPDNGASFNFHGLYDTNSSLFSLDYLSPYKIIIGTRCENIYGTHNQKNGSIKELYIGKSCKSIYSAFESCHSLQSVTIPSSVTSIGAYAFYGCSSLQSVTIPSSVTSILSEAFTNCYSLQSVTIPSSVTNIVNGVFNKCYSLSIYNKSSAVDDNKNSIYNTVELTADKCNSRFVKSVTIPSSVTTILGYAFQECYSLQSVTIPESVTSIGGYAFENCYSLQYVNIPSGVTTIRSDTFDSCYSLRSITIPESTTSIEYSAFYQCHSLQSVTIPSSVTTIRSGAFQNCYSLQSVTIQSSGAKFEGMTFYQCHSLQSVTIPSSVTKIENYDFGDCFSIQSITIPSSVTSIGYNAFNNTRCVLDFGNERTTVPTIASTTSIGYNYCIVPDALYDEWCAATNWSSMTEKIIKHSDYYK